MSYNKGEFNKKAHYFDDLNEIFDEQGSSFISMRRVQWVEEGEQPDREKSKLELRKYRVTDRGEFANGGFSFLTEDGPHELTKVLLHNGYGHTKDCLLELKQREDFKESVEHLYDSEEDSEDGEYFDMRDMLLADEELDEEEENDV